MILINDYALVSGVLPLSGVSGVSGVSGSVGGFLLVFTTCGTRFEVGLLVSDDCVDVTDKLGVALLVVQTLPYF